MRCFGYVKGTDDTGPSELREVTLLLSPTVLREMARFFAHAADQMEAHGDRFGHEHFGDFAAEIAPNFELIVASEKYLNQQ